MRLADAGVDDALGWKMMGVGDAVDDAASAKSEEPSRRNHRFLEAPEFPGKAET